MALEETTVVHAFVMAKVEAGKDKEVFNALGKISGIKNAYAAYGTYDLIIEANLNTVEELDEFVFDKIRKISGVKETVTIICSSSQM